MDVNRSNQTNLTNQIGGNSPPDFSPDGTEILFISNRDGNGEIYLMEIDGTNQKNLSNNIRKDRSPMFQPKISF